VTEGLLYRRGNFTVARPADRGALLAVQGRTCVLARFRGTTLLQACDYHGQPHDQTAITYATATVNQLTGEQIKVIWRTFLTTSTTQILYYQQGGDMVRVGGLPVHARSSPSGGPPHPKRDD